MPFSPFFLQLITALGAECFTLQKNLDVSPSGTFLEYGEMTDTLEEIPET